MKIGIDVQPLQYSARDSGIGFYIRNLLREIHSLPSRHTFYLFINNRAPRRSDLKLDPSLHWPTISLDRGILPGEHADIDLFHSNSIAEFDGVTIPRPAGPCKIVVTVHDIIPMIFKEQHPAYWSDSPDANPYDRRIDDVRAADAVLTVSNHSKFDIVEHCSIPADQVFVTHCAVNDEYRPVNAPHKIRQVRQRYNLPQKYILYVGGYYSHRKNIHGVLSAYRRFLELSRLMQHKLVLAGVDDAHAAIREEIHEMLNCRGLDGQVHPTGFIPDSDLPTVFSEAEVFFYPSLYEGFGLTPLQAMACGTPVVTSNRSSIPEVVGTGAELVDPEDIDALAEALIRVATNAGLRRKLVKSGYRRAGLFSWRRTARRTLEVYERVLSGS
jgi:glycosyltransferase involved in cell wall biosynthesis